MHGSFVSSVNESVETLEMCHCALQFYSDGRFIIAVWPQRAVGLVNALHKCHCINLLDSNDIHRVCCCHCHFDAETSHMSNVTQLAVAKLPAHQQ